MLKLEDQVCSLELAKRLKELDVKQESLFEWLYFPPLDKWEVSPRFSNLGCSAFTVAELINMLQEFCNSIIIPTNVNAASYLGGMLCGFLKNSAKKD